MRNFLIYLTWIFILPAMLLTPGCGSGESRQEAADSIYSVEYLNSISIDNPERALALLDTAEQKKLLSEFDIARLRCLAYHNGLSDYKNALRYGLEAYDMPEARRDAEILLLLLGVIADDYYQNGNYEESVRICTEGLKLASDSLLKDQVANFDVSLATNLWELGRKDEAYLSRKDLMAEYKIPANKFAMLFKEYAGCTFSQYIQNCRLDYAVKLMRENPQWNFDAIAKEAQMSNGAFYSHFKRRFGMSPSDFRGGEASISSQKQSE